MWLWDDALRELGFRRKSDRYWLCERRYGLRGNDHVSVWSWSEQTIPAGRNRVRYLVEVTEFHVTFYLGGEHVHFYYHERAENAWAPGGHTSDAEIHRVGHDPAAARRAADAVAADLVATLGGSWRRRKRSRR